MSYLKPNRFSRTLFKGKKQKYLICPLNAVSVIVSSLVYLYCLSSILQPEENLPFSLFRGKISYITFKHTWHCGRN
jgi:hypothetical protein